MAICGLFCPSECLSMFVNTLPLCELPQLNQRWSKEWRRLLVQKQKSLASWVDLIGHFVTTGYEGNCTQELVVKNLAFDIQSLVVPHCSFLFSYCYSPGNFCVLKVSFVQLVLLKTNLSKHLIWRRFAVMEYRVGHTRWSCCSKIYWRETFSVYSLWM